MKYFLDNNNNAISVSDTGEATFDGAVVNIDTNKKTVEFLSSKDEKTTTAKLYPSLVELALAQGRDGVEVYEIGFLKQMMNVLGRIDETFTHGMFKYRIVKIIGSTAICIEE